MAFLKLAGIVVDLSANSTQYVKELQVVNRKTKRWSKDVNASFTKVSRNLVALVATYLSYAASMESLTRAMSTAKEIEGLARLAGQSVEDFQAAAYATERYGMSAEKLGDISKDVSDKLGDFIATGGGEFKDFFEKVAPQVGLTASQLQRLSGPEVLQAVKDAMDAANIPMKQQVFYLEAIANDASKLIPLLENNGRKMNALEQEYRDMGVALSETDIQVLLDMEKSIANAKKEAESLSNTIWIKLAGAFEALSNAGASFFKAFNKNIQAFPARSLEFQIEAINKKIRSSEQLVTNYMATIEAGKKAGASTSDMMGAVRAQANLEQEKEKLVQLTKALNDLEDELDQVQGKTKNPLVIEVNTGKDNDLNKIDDQFKYMNEQMRIFAEDSKDVFGNIADASMDWSNSLSQNLTDMVLTGKASFGDLATSIVNDLVRIMIQSMITENFLKAVTNISSAAGIKPPASSGSAPAAKATGGPVSRGSTYLVGEKGPELFTASNSGNIVPNNQLGGNTQVNIYTQPGESAETRTKQGGQGDIVEVFMKQVDSRMNEQISRGQGLARTLEGRYALSRKSY